MRVPTVQGIIDRRILINYRVAPERVAAVLPKPFEPHLVKGNSIVGICLIRLKKIRPRFLPEIFGLSSENAAVRIAVRWQSDGKEQFGVYIPRRDSSSIINQMVGGRLFPGVHHAADFDVDETERRFKVRMRSRDGKTYVKVDASLSDHVPVHSVFESVGAASRFFEAGNLGYSPGTRDHQYDGLQCDIHKWGMQPLAIDRLDATLPVGEGLTLSDQSVFDSAFLMRDIRHCWRDRGSLCAG